MTLHIQSDPSCTIGVDRTFNIGHAYVANVAYKNKKLVKRSSRDIPIFLGPVFCHWDASYFTYNTFFSHVKARLDSNVQCIDIRIGSDDERGLTKAIDNVFPNATRCLCSKYIKNNVTDHIKSKLSITKDQRSDIMSNFLGDNGIINADDTTDFDVRSENLCSSFPVCADYLNFKLRTRMLD